MVGNQVLKVQPMNQVQKPQSSTGETTFLTTTNKSDESDKNPGNKNPNQIVLGSSLKVLKVSRDFLKIDSKIKFNIL
jgi:hypothetical protein